MPRPGKPLTALQVKNLKAPGRYFDSGGLVLQISSTGARSWLFRYKRGNRKSHREMGLGSLRDVSLAEARDKALELRKQLDKGLDPIVTRREAQASQTMAEGNAMTFKQCAVAYIASQKDAWRNSKHADQWGATLELYAYPILGEMPVAQVGVGHVLKVLEQSCEDVEGDPTLWSAKTETASRVRGRIENILDWAKVREYRTGDNPARWRGNLEHSLPPRSKVQKVQHHAALPYAEVGAFMVDLRKRPALAARALEFLILTATRTRETLEARWSEIDLDNQLWIIPADRMKAAREHRVPLADHAVRILHDLKNDSAGAFVFPTEGKLDRPLSNNSLLSLLRRMERTDITAHGFRSTFRDWAAETTNYPREVAEMALAHTIGDKVEAAYRRGDLFEKRERLMGEWATYCSTVRKPGEVIAINRKAKKV
jgi:integrase